MNSFVNLSQEELKELSKAPLYVGLLIAQADGETNHKELEWIEKVTHFRIKTSHHSLRSYYKMANEEVVTNLKLVMSQLPENQADKMNFLSDKLAELKPILNKLDDGLRHRLLDSYHSMALSIAEISGGLLNFFSTNAEEEKWLSLDMLQ